MFRDVQFAVRSLARSPGLAAVIVASLALGTGANAAVYCTVDALLFRPPAGVEQPASLVDLYTSQGNGATYGASSYPDYESFATASQIERVAAIDERNETAIRLGDTLVNANVAAVSDTFWDVLRSRPALGEWVAPDRRTSEGVVISFDLWRTAGQDPQVLGRAVTVGSRTYSVIAVAPPRFRGLQLGHLVDVWVPLESADRTTRGTRRLRAIARLAAGAHLEQLQDALSAMSLDLAARYPETNRGTIRSPDAPRRFTAVRYSRLDSALRSEAELLAAALLAATSLLLISGCVNAGSLLVSRGLARRTELTIKTALGADRAMLVRQLVIEALMLASSGAAAGAIAAAWTAGAIPALFAPEHATLLDTHVDRSVILVMLAAGVVSGALFGVGPALLSTRALSPDLLRGDASRIGDRGAGPRLRMTLVGAQLALSTIFLMESALLMKMVDTALMMDHSRANGSLVLASIESVEPEFRDAASARLRNVPSIQVAGWVATPPLARPARREFRIDRGATTEFAEFDVNFASAGYFRAMQIHLINGRLFSGQEEAAGANVVVVNAALAERYFNGSPAGQILTSADGTSVEIVGVVQTRTYRAFEGPPQPMIFYPISRASARAFYAVVRSRADATTIEQDVRGALTATGGATRLEVSTFDAHLGRALATDRLIVRLVAACGFIALGLAAIGVYGVMTDIVRRRTRDIGLRIALGAGPWPIARMFAVATLSPAFIGVLTGLLGSALLLRVARSLIFGLPSIDPARGALVAGGLALVIVAAILPPMRRAVRMSPLVALRENQ